MGTFSHPISFFHINLNNLVDNQNVYFRHFVEMQASMANKQAQLMLYFEVYYTSNIFFPYNVPTPREVI